MSKPHPDKSKTFHSKDNRFRFFYAGGSRGDHVRADGNGGYLARGWYVVDLITNIRSAPATCLTEARRTAFEMRQDATLS